jgi:ACS family hexuronate transporter-like MFS transporter
VLSRTSAWAVALTATLAMAVSYVDRQTLAVVAPTVTQALGISDAAYGWLGSAFAIAYLLVGPAAGALVDRIGARRGLPAAIAMWTAVAAAHALAPGFAALFVLRLLLGVTEAPSFPAGAQVVQRALAPADRARGMSTLFVGMSLGGMLAPPVAIALTTRFSWRAAFVGTAAIAAAWLPLWWALARRNDVREALDARPPVRADVRLFDAALHPAMRRGLVGVLVVVPASTFMLSWEAKFYVRETHLAQGSLAPYLMASALLYDAGALLFGDLASRRARARGDSSPPRLLFAIGALLIGCGVVVLSGAHAPAGALAGMALVATGRGAVVALANSDTLARVPQQIIAAAAGVIASVQSLCAIVVNPLIGAVVQHHGYGGIVLALGAWAVPLAAVWIAWRAPQPAAVVTGENPQEGRKNGR